MGYPKRSRKGEESNKKAVHRRPALQKNTTPIISWGNLDVNGKKG
jgi:hypothetical protein